MEHFYAVVVKINEVQIVELLKDKVTGIKQQIAAGMIFDPLQKHFEGDPVVQVLSGMNFKAQIHSGLIKCVQDRQPAGGEVLEGSLDESGRSLRPRIDVRPRQGS